MKKYILLATLVLIIVISFFTFNKQDALDELNGDYWQGTWLSEKTKVQGTFILTIVREDSNISGKIRIYGSSITTGGDIKGIIKDNDEIEFGMIKDKRGELRYFGKISENNMSGTWTISVIKDQGIWEAKKEKT